MNFDFPLPADVKNKTPRSRFIKHFVVICLSVLAIAAYLYNASSRKLIFGNSSDTIFENANLRIDQIGLLPRLAISYNIMGDVYATEDHNVFKRTKEHNVFNELGNFDKANPSITERAKDFIARLRITRDLRNNFGANDCVVLKSNTILIFYDKIYRSVDRGKSFQSVFDYKKSHIYPPFSHGIAVDKNDNIYFGEYNTTQRPHKIRIMKGSKDGSVWSTFYEFPPGEIFHIHSIKYDSFRDVLWICSGDLGEENRLMYIDKSRKKVVTLGAGDQSWRIISPITTKDFLYWCTDNNLTGSNIYRYSFSNNKREKLDFVGNPSYYSTLLNDGTLVFSTTYEPLSPHTESFNPERTTDLWISKNGTDWYKVLSLPAEIYETGYGPSLPMIILPAGDYSSDYLFITPFNVSKSDFSTRVLQITWKP